MDKKSASTQQLRELLNALGRRSHDAGSALSSKDRMALAIMERDNKLDIYNQNRNMMKFAGLTSILKGLAKKTAPVGRGAAKGIGTIGAGAVGGLVGSLALPAVIGGGAYLAYKNPNKAKNLAMDAGLRDLMSESGKGFADSAINEIEANPEYQRFMDVAEGYNSDDVENMVNYGKSKLNDYLG